MHEVLYPALAAVAWIGLAVKLRDLRRGRNPSRVAVCGALALLASTFTVSTPAVWSWLDRTTGVANLAALWAHLCVVAFSGTVQLLVLWWVNPPEAARPRARARLVLLAVTAVAMVALFLAAGPTEPRTTDFVATYAGRPVFAAYLLVYLAAFALGMVDVVRLCWPYSRLAGRSWLRRGLRTTAVGAASGLLYAAVRVADVIGAQMGADVRRWEPIAPPAASLGALLVILGLTMPAWGPRLSEFRGWLRRRRQYRQLQPLWADLHRLMPQIALEPPATTPLGDLDRRLYRRVIELYDGSLALRPYLDEAAAGRAGRIGARLGLRADDLAAVMEAARLRGAVHAYAHGEPRATVEEGGDEPPPGRLDEGADLAQEVARLVRVSRAYAGSPVVAAAVAGRDALPAEETEVAM
ncbi:MAB_1171c family putative transporter [Phytohabitans kaempferiae]|uniref:MAB_1171c family putative transporter n=1 Tax=Phytohabitans kaempferiae TaxID=1620943 RepID=A0ABV6M0H8_9ACTN